MLPDFSSIHSLWDAISMLVEFFVGTIVIKYLIVKWIAELTRRMFAWMFVRSRREVAIWLHYRNLRHRQKGKYL